MRIFTFFQAQKQVFNLMKFDSYSRFLKSALYQECLERDSRGDDLEFSGEASLDPELRILPPASASHQHNNVSFNVFRNYEFQCKQIIAGESDTEAKCRPPGNERAKNVLNRKVSILSKDPCQIYIGNFRDKNYSNGIKLIGNDIAEPGNIKSSEASIVNGSHFDSKLRSVDTLADELPKLSIKVKNSGTNTEVKCDTEELRSVAKSDEQPLSVRNSVLKTMVESHARRSLLQDGAQSEERDTALVATVATSHQQGNVSVVEKPTCPTVKIIPSPELDGPTVEVKRAIANMVRHNSQRYKNSRSGEDYDVDTLSNLTNSENYAEFIEKTWKLDFEKIGKLLGDIDDSENTSNRERPVQHYDPLGLCVPDNTLMHTLISSNSSENLSNIANHNSLGYNSSSDSICLETQSLPRQKTKVRNFFRSIRRNRNNALKTSTTSLPQSFDSPYQIRTTKHGSQFVVNKDARAMPTQSVDRLQFSQPKQSEHKVFHEYPRVDYTKTNKDTKSTQGISRSKSVSIEKNNNATQNTCPYLVVMQRERSFCVGKNKNYDLGEMPVFKSSWKK